MKWSCGEINRGDIVRVKIENFYHFGIYVTDDDVVQFGYPPVNGIGAYREEDIKVVYTSLADFSCGKEVEHSVFSKSEMKKRFPVNEITATAYQKIGQGGYDILLNNSEHFVYECTFGEKKSLMLEKYRKENKKKSILHIYISKIPENLVTDKLYPHERLNEVIGTKDALLKKQKFWSWKLLERAVKSSFYEDIETQTFKKDKYGKWTTKDYDFSIAHCENYVCVAVSNNTHVGIDLELKSLFDQKLAEKESIADFEKKVLCKKELNFSYTVKDLLLLWEKKQSIFKCFGKKKFEPHKIDTTRYGCSVYNPAENPDLSIVVCGKKIENIKFFFDNQ